MKTSMKKPERSVEEFAFKAIKEYWGLHVGPKSGQHMQEKVLNKIYLKLKDQERQKQEEMVEAERERIRVNVLNWLWKNTNETVDVFTARPSDLLSDLQALTQPNNK